MGSQDEKNESDMDDGVDDISYYRITVHYSGNADVVVIEVE